MKIFKQFSKKGYKHYTENTIEELDELPLNNHHIITEFAHLCEWIRVNHGIWIGVSQDWHGGKMLGYEALIEAEDGEQTISTVTCKTPQKAYSAAFDYIFKNNLI
jgi:hypothetical protein